MTFKKWSLMAFAAALVAPLSASALGIQIANIGSLPAVVGNGDTITFDLILENSTAESISGLDVGVFGYDEGIVGLAADNHLQFAGAQTGAGAFGAVFASGANLGGLPAAVPQQEFGNPVTFNERFVRLFGGVSILPLNGDGTNDSGIAGLQTTPGGDVHLQVSFTAQALGAAAGSPATVDLVFGIGQQGFDVVSPTGSLSGIWNNANYTVTIVPEPGTALLMGLGLAGLAGVRRR